MFRESVYREWPDAAEVVGESVVKFTLHYKGKLPSCTQNDSRTKEKQELREYFEPQLELLWQEEPVLAALLKRKNAFHAFRFKGEKILSPDDHIEMHEWVWLPDMEKANERTTFYIPLVTRRNGLGCRLDIKFMRPGHPGGVINGGDIDNRIKTLFDGLRMPHRADEIKGASPRASFYCLLEDDALVTDLSVATEQLLVPESKAKGEVVLSVGVTIHVVRPNEMNRDYRD